MLLGGTITFIRLCFVRSVDPFNSSFDSNQGQTVKEVYSLSVATDRPPSPTTDSNPDQLTIAQQINANHSAKQQKHSKQQRIRQRAKCSTATQTTRHKNDQNCKTTLFSLKQDRGQPASRSKRERVCGEKKQHNDIPQTLAATPQTCNNDIPQTLAATPQTCCTCHAEENDHCK